MAGIATLQATADSSTAKKPFRNDKSVEIEQETGRRRGMKDWENFRTFKERGEWVELQFMAAAASHGYRVLKPWGDSLEYDVAVEHAGDMIRVQVKSSSVRNGTGYFCQFRRNWLVEEPYSIDELDIFATYVIPEDVWYLIPAAVLLTPPRKVGITVCPMTALRKNRYRYEQYREAWDLLGRTRFDLIAQGKAHAASIRSLHKGTSTNKRRGYPERSSIVLKGRGL